IDRVEVISGPGGTLWGGNAVNGVINIITKSAAQTRGSIVDARAGTQGGQLGARIGGAAGAGGSFRGYRIGLGPGSLARVTGASADDSWNLLQSGFRADWKKAADGFTVQGDLYRGTGIGQPAVLSSGTISGGDLSATWDRTFTNGHLHTQTYFDNARRLLVS